MSWNSKQSETRNNVLTIGLFWILRARLAYLNVFNVSSALMSAGLMQAAGEGHIPQVSVTQAKAFCDCQFAVSVKISIDTYVSSSMEG